MLNFPDLAIPAWDANAESWNIRVQIVVGSFTIKCYLTRLPKDRRGRFAVCPGLLPWLTPSKIGNVTKEMFPKELPSQGFMVGQPGTGQ